MMTDMTNDVFAETSYGKIALKKMRDLPENFRLFYAGWLHDTSDVMQVKGAEFRIAKSGENKGTLSILIKGTERVAYVTKEEMNAEYGNT